MKNFSVNLSLTKMAIFPAKMTEKHFGTAFDIIVYVRASVAQAVFDMTTLLL